MAGEGDAEDERWVDEHAGPVVRPYAVTRGRARPVTGSFDLISLVTATRTTVVEEGGLGPEHVAIVALTQHIQSVAEVAARLDLPVGTVRVLLGDLVARDLVRVQEPREPSGVKDESIYEAVINGLRAL
ncbi:DUF742 domain-containing protein [Micromonospora rifamycinica]|uniref:DUF742 domain-containing protein n=1 Tax=Micromonospora rifamycinica TaxID=291594 RepID=UPI002E29348E|nr:DUF742 domain-containing protein [Micromonospora rifamycinica]